VTNLKYQKDALPPSIGRLSIIEWDIDLPNGKFNSREIPLRSCTAEDLSRFYQPNKYNKQAWETLQHTLKCLDSDSMKLNLN